MTHPIHGQNKVPGMTPPPKADIPREVLSAAEAAGSVAGDAFLNVQNTLAARQPKKLENPSKTPAGNSEKSQSTAKKVFATPGFKILGNALRRAG